MSHQSIQKYLVSYQRRVNRALDRYLPSESRFPSIIHKAMRYSVMAGGKRLRAILALLAGKMIARPQSVPHLCGSAKESAIMPAACALELVHTYSLIHDDLPAMDNDDFRRGQPTSHKVFGEAMAILAGDALLTYAFQLLGQKITDKKMVSALVSELAVAAGSIGMIGGQVLDIGNNPISVRGDLKLLHQTHLRKTAMMITASCRMGAIIAGANPKQLGRITAYGKNLGLAFQIIDDILDVKGTKKALGKTPGKDAKLDKLTYPAVKGLAQSTKEAVRLIGQAKRSLEPFGKRGAALAELADYILKRQN